jgi:hypothetical protein
MTSVWAADLAAEFMFLKTGSGGKKNGTKE